MAIQTTISSSDTINGVVHILHGNGNDYKFLSETFLNSNIPADITFIEIDPNATGDFTILIDNPDPNIAGAVNLWVFSTRQSE